MKDRKQSTSIGSRHDTVSLSNIVYTSNFCSLIKVSTKSKADNAALFVSSRSYVKNVNTGRKRQRQEIKVTQMLRKQTRKGRMRKICFAYSRTGESGQE